MTHNNQQNDDWDEGLFNVFSAGAGTCFKGFCCPNCVSASARTDHDGSDWWFNCCCINQVVARSIVREGYGIAGGCFGDIFWGGCCGPCSAIQIAHEATVRGLRKK